MNELFQLMDGLPTESKSAHHQRQFDTFRKCLITGNASKFDREADTLALDALEQLEKLLRAGEPNPETLAILADFLREVSRDAGKSAHALAENTKLAYRILGHKPNGRTSKRFGLERMLATFETLKGDGIDEKTAERAAYDTYFEGEGRTFEADHAKKDGIGGAEFSEAEITMGKVIRPALRKAGLVSKKRAGRPKLS